MGSRSTQPDDTSEALRRELSTESERRISTEAGFQVHPPSAPTPNLESVAEPNMARVILAGMCRAGPGPHTKNPTKIHTILQNRAFKPFNQPKQTRMMQIEILQVDYIRNMC